MVTHTLTVRTVPARMVLVEWIRNTIGFVTGAFLPLISVLALVVAEGVPSLRVCRDPWNLLLCPLMGRRALLFPAHRVMKQDEGDPPGKSTEQDPHAQGKHNGNESCYHFG
jgi:hypothetical protein